MFTTPDIGITQVEFYLDGVQICVEEFAPFEMLGGKALDVSSLEPGKHIIKAVVSVDGGVDQDISASFVVEKSGVVIQIPEGVTSFTIEWTQ